MYVASPLPLSLPHARLPQPSPLLPCCANFPVAVNYIWYFYEDRPNDKVCQRKISTQRSQDLVAGQRQAGPGVSCPCATIKLDINDSFFFFSSFAPACVEYFLIKISWSVFFGHWDFTIWYENWIGIQKNRDATLPYLLTWAALSLCYKYDKINVTDKEKTLQINTLGKGINTIGAQRGVSLVTLYVFIDIKFLLFINKWSISIIGAQRGLFTRVHRHYFISIV